MNINITPEQLEAKRATLAKNGITVTGDSGQINSHGCVVNYAYDGNTLTLTVVSKPFYISESIIEEKLAEFFQ